MLLTSIKLQLVIEIFIFSIFDSRFTQVLLYFIMIRRVVFNMLSFLS